MTSIHYVDYILIDMFCIAILYILLHNHIKTSGMQNTSRIYMKMIVCNILNFSLDIAFTLFNSNFIGTNRYIFYIINVLYFYSSAMAGIFWLFYVAEEHNLNWFHKPRNYTMSFIPISIYALLTATSWWTKLIFYIDSGGMYHRGTVFVLQYAVPYIYILTASIISLVRAIDKKNYLNKRKYLLLSAYIIPSLISSIIIMLFIRDLPLLSIGTTSVLLIIYLDHQNEKISIDPLTQINNRFQIIRYLNTKISMHEDKKHLYLFMMDLNMFKKINDNYGHVEGDAALVRVATVLKKVCYNKDYFIGRYGGDEFILIAEIENKEAANEICSEIHKQIEEANAKANTTYQISLSIGAAQYTKSYKDIVSFIAAADEELYKIKKARKVKR